MKLYVWILPWKKGFSPDLDFCLRFRLKSVSTDLAGFPKQLSQNFG